MGEVYYRFSEINKALSEFEKGSVVFNTAQAGTLTTIKIPI